MKKEEKVEKMEKMEKEEKEEKEEKIEKEDGKDIDELTKLRNEVSEYKDKYLRTLAEIENLNKRLSKEKEDFIKYASSALIAKIIPVLDDFEIALKINDKKIDKNFLEGIKLIYNNLKEILEEEGLKRQQTVGMRFNPNEHEVVSISETDKDEEDGIIIEELRSGFYFKDIVIRPAMVKIAKKKEVDRVEKVKEVEEEKKGQESKENK
jgi:molecular chaperone GrpE